jgi:hypothetical protein
VCAAVLVLTTTNARRVVGVDRGVGCFKIVCDLLTVALC